MVQVYNIKDHAIVIKKGTSVAQMVAANEVPETVVAKVGQRRPCRTHHQGKKENLV